VKLIEKAHELFEKAETFLKYFCDELFN